MLGLSEMTRSLQSEGYYKCCDAHNYPNYKWVKGSFFERVLSVLAGLALRVRYPEWYATYSRRLGIF